MPYSWIAIIALTVALAATGYGLKSSWESNAALSMNLLQAQADIKQAKESQAAVSIIDQSHQAKIDEIKSDQTKLDRAVSARTVILRVPAKCVPGTPSPASQPDEQRPELDPDARQNYLNLRSGIMEREVKIDGLQDYITKICLKL